MRMIQHEVLRRHFIPNVARAPRTGDIVLPTDARPRPRRPSQELTRLALAPAPIRSSRSAGGLRTLLSVGSTVLLAVLGEKTFNRTLAQRGVVGALVRGSVAAGAAYVQDRHAHGARAALESRPPERSILSVYVVAGIGLGLGALIANRRR